MEDNELVLYLLQKTYFFKKFKESMKNALESEDFDDSVNHLKSASEDIATLEEFIKEMKQEQHDLLNDVYNKFKDMGLVKNIKF